MLRQALRANPRRQQTAISARAPAPVGGWNALDPLAGMKPEYAVILDNWIPRAGFAEVRRGSRQFVTGSADPVESLIPWRGDASGADKLFACAGTGVFETTTFGAAWPASSHTITNPRVESTSFANSGGSYAICANGADTPFSYNGTTWANLTITGSSGPITLDPKTLTNPTQHKNRLHFIETGSLHVWYLDTTAIQGAAQLLDLGPIFQQGGTLAALGTWTGAAAASVGQEQFFVALTTQGEVAVYQGDDPSNVLYWTLVGTFQTSHPLGHRPLLRFGADIIALTTAGAVPFSQAINLDRSQQNNVAITQKIQNAFLSAAESYAANFGWDSIFYPQGSLAIFNVPVVELTTSVQFVQNLQTGAWCQFRGLNAFCWETANDDIFFGTTEGVHQWDIGVTDASTDLFCEMLCAFNYFGDTAQKNFTMVRPILNATANVLPAMEIMTDFKHDDSHVISVPTVVDDRSMTLSIRSDWNGCQGIGFCGAVHMHVTLSVAGGLQDELGIGTGDNLGDGAGNDLVTDSGEPLEADVQYISADVLYTRGGPL